jgi:hypothetical protein
MMPIATSIMVYGIFILEEKKAAAKTVARKIGTRYSDARTICSFPGEEEVVVAAVVVAAAAAAAPPTFAKIMFATPAAAAKTTTAAIPAKKSATYLFIWGHKSIVRATQKAKSVEVEAAHSCQAGFANKRKRPAHISSPLRLLPQRRQQRLDAILPAG